MRNFYIRLAVSNIKKNKPVYYPFFFDKYSVCNDFLCYGFNPKPDDHCYTARKLYFCSVS